MFEYKDSYSYGVAAILALLAWWLDVIAIRIALAVAAVTFLAWPFFHKRFAMTLPTTLMLVCVCGTAVGMAWQLVFFGLPWKTSATINKPSAEAKVLFQCFGGLAQIVVPATGRMPVLPLLSGNIRTLIQRGLTREHPLAAYFTSSPPGSLWDFLGNKNQMIYRCEITNYESVPLFSVQADLHLVFRKAVKRADSSGTESGDVILDTLYRIQIPRIDIGPSNPFVFIMHNMADNEFVFVELPREITAQRLGDDSRHTIRLIEPDTRELFLSPFVQTVPQESDKRSPESALPQTMADAESPQWETLTATEKVNLRDRLRNEPAKSLTVYCVNSHCVDLGADMVGVFAQAGWQVKQHNGGGIGIDGLTGIRITSCNGTAQMLKTTIEAETKLKNIEAMDEAPCSDTALIIGIKPF